MGRGGGWKEAVAQVFWDVILCHWMEGFWYPQSLYCLPVEGYCSSFFSHYMNVMLRYPKDGGSLILRNIPNDSPKEITWHPKRLESSELRHCWVYVSRIAQSELMGFCGEDTDCVGFMVVIENIWVCGDNN